MATRKKTTRTRRQTSRREEKGLTFSHFALVGLMIAAAAGWYANLQPHEITAKKTNQTVAIAPKPVLRTTESSQPTLHTIIAMNTEPSNAPIPVRAPIRNIEILTKPLPQTLPTVPYKPDTSLPPQGHFGLNNAANKVYANKKILIYAEPRKEAKVVATLIEGQEMRSYEKNDQWQRIVVPTTDIIGWAKSSELKKVVVNQTRAADKTIMTGSIKNTSR